jgi:hypothetical protein
MKEVQEQYEGHRIEVLDRKGQPVLLIDGVPVRYGRLPDGRYFLDQYAYDWNESLLELARRFLDHRRKAEKVRRERRAVK